MRASAAAGASLLALVLMAFGCDVTLAAQPLGTVISGVQHPAFPSSTPNQGLISFLQSPAGVVIGGIAVLAAGVAAAYVLLPLTRPLREPARRQRSRGRRDRRSRRPEPSVNAEQPRPLAGPIGAALAAGCLLLPLVFTIAFEDVFAQPKTWLLWGLAAVVAAMMVGAAIRGARPIGAGVIDLAAGAFILLAAGATILANDPWHSLIGERLQFQGLLTWTAYVVLFYGARYAFTTARQVWAISLALGAAAVAVSAYGLAQQLGADPIWSDLFKNRIFSMLGQANALAAFLATAVVMVIPLVIGRRPVTLGVLGLGVAAALITLFLSYGRGGYLGLIVGLVVAGLVLLRGMDTGRLRRLAPRAAGAVGALLLLVVVAGVLWQPAGDVISHVWQRATTIVDPNESSNRIRLDLWSVAVRITAEHPLFGTGPDSYVLVFPGYRDAVLAPDRAQHLALFRVESPHNVYLAIASGAGLPALIAFVVFVAGCAWHGVRAAWGALTSVSRFALAGVMGGVSVVLVTNGFMTGEPATSGIWFMLLGALAGLSVQLRSRADQEVQPPESVDSEPAGTS